MRIDLPKERAKPKAEPDIVKRTIDSETEVFDS
jgi:hypothetical protein